jgi:two-component system chemotaxis response regulator CheV
MDMETGLNAFTHTDILLESGTNELEIMEFTIAGEIFGINVAKVREIMKYAPVKPMQNAHFAIEGIFKPRDDVITVVDLAKYLGLGESEYQERDIYMITEFNSQVVGFHVHSVVGIDRISWMNIKKPDNIIYGGSEGVATGIATYEGRLITILDFEKIVAEIAPQMSIQVSEVEAMGHRHRSDLPILIAEDSRLLSKMIVESLHKAGYVNTIKTDNGQEALDFLTEAKEEDGALVSHVACVITDIEMPQMDGHHLTKVIKDDPVLRRLPVILFSSLINEEMRLKGEEVGADAQISKPEIARLVTMIDHMTGSDWEPVAH